MDIVPKTDYEHLLSETAQQSKAYATKTKAKHKLLAAADEAFDVIGGVPRFAIWADQNPTEFYKMYAKTLPQNIDVTGEITIRPALPPSPLDDPIDVTPTEVSDAGRTGSALQPDRRPLSLSAPGSGEGDYSSIGSTLEPAREYERVNRRAEVTEADGESGGQGH